MKQSSRQIEETWRIFTHPKDHSLTEVAEAGELLVRSKDQLFTMIQLGGSGPDTEVYNRVMLGVSHYPDFAFPPELKYKANSN